MKEKYQCPECKQKRMINLTLLQRWWCQFCQVEIDIEQTIKEWSEKGYQGEENGRP